MSATEIEAAKQRLEESKKVVEELTEVQIDSYEVALGKFCITGTGFGEERGRFSIDTMPAEITRWKDTSIKGIVPEGAEIKDSLLIVRKKKIQLALKRAVLKTQ